MQGRQHERLLGLTERYLGQRVNIAPTLTNLRENPATLERIVWQFDQVVESLNCYTRSPAWIEDLERDLVPHAIKLGETLKGNPLPTLSQFEQSCERRFYVAGGKAFREANRLMQQGEAG